MPFTILNEHTERGHNAGWLSPLVDVCPGRCLTGFLFRNKARPDELVNKRIGDMARGRPPNPFRDVARQAGEKFYAEADDCIFCGTNKHYTVNGACVACTVARGVARYAALDEAAKAKIAAADHDRYVKRLADQS